MKNEKQFTTVQAHENEIMQTRIGGLGGSDAKMVLKVGLNGLSALSQTDINRLMVMTSQALPQDVPTNKYMEAGHKFEEVVEDALKEATKLDFVREYYLEADTNLDLSFKTFAHADFYAPNNGVAVECKYSQKDTEQVKRDYEAQLQWYYVLGAKSVVLYHGTGEAEPFELQDCEVARIERDEVIINALYCGLTLIDQYIHSEDWTMATTMTVAEIDAHQQSNVIACKTRLAQIAEAEAALKGMRQELLEYMESNGIKKIDAGDCTVTYVSATSKRTFDTKAAQAKYTELKGEEFYKVSPVESTIKIELK